MSCRKSAAGQFVQWSESRTVAGRDSILVGIPVVSWVRLCAQDPTDERCRARSSQTGTAASWVPPAVAVIRRSLMDCTEPTDGRLPSTVPGPSGGSLRPGRATSFSRG